MKQGHHLLTALALALSMAAVNPAGAADQSQEDVAGHRLSLHGFGTLGLARSDDDDAQFVRDLSQPSGLTSRWSTKVDSMIGLQAGYRFNDKLEGVLQVVSRYHSEGNFSPEVSWAFLRYDPDPTASVRIGRLGTEFYMLADSRLVGYANLTVRPPPDYFGPLVLSYIDGIDGAKSVPVGNGLLRGKLFTGVSPEKMSLSDGLYWNMSGSLVVGGHLDYLTGPWQIRIGQTRVRFDKDLPINEYTGLDITGQVPEMSVVGKWTRYDSLGVVYDNSPFQLQLMLSRIDQGSAAFEDSRAGYAIASYRTGNVTPFLGYSRTKSDANHFNSTPPLEQATAAFLSASTHSDQHTWFLGARWDLRKDLDLKAQVDWVRGSPGSVFPFRAETPSWDGHMTVFSLALDYVF
ncbi:MAG: hypothetical protein PHR30_09475 [Gallionellaceae bacterium]|nr:hypothetical protein [Gallionellaceae bacterium]